jgi:MFS family permease
VYLVAGLGGAQVLGMLGFAGYSALLPTFIDEWAMSNTDAGIISGSLFAGYMAAVPFLVGTTDRYDPRRIFLGSTVVAALASFAFAFFAEGFWSALLPRIFAGVGLAGTYMPGLKILSDRLTGKTQFRAYALYTSCFSVGAALSYYFSGEIAHWFGWQWVFGVAGAAAVAGLVLVLVMVPHVSFTPSAPDTHVLDYRPVLRNRAAMAYIVAYGTHMWELFGQRSWMVAFLVFALAQHPDAGATALTGTVIAAIANLMGVPANIACNELAVRLGRVRVASVVCILGAALSCTIGFLGDLPYHLLAVLMICHSMLAYGDSGALIGGTVEAASAGHRGATMAVLSLIGFSGGFLGSVVFGAVLDLAGGRAEHHAWGIAFASLGIAALFGPVAMAMGASRRKAAA